MIYKRTIPILLLGMCVFVACSGMRDLKRQSPRVSVGLPPISPLVVSSVSTLEDTIEEQERTQNVSDKSLLIKNGMEVGVELDTVGRQNITSLILPEVQVSATQWRNVVERNGKISIELVLGIPKELQHNKRMLDVYPVLLRGAEKDSLDMLRYMGAYFQKRQERGYARYKNYLSHIVPDNADSLEAFGNRRGFMHYMERLNFEKKKLYRKWNEWEKKKQNPNPLYDRMSFFNSRVRISEMKLADIRKFVRYGSNLTALQFVSEWSSDTIKVVNRKLYDRILFFNERKERNRSWLDTRILKERNDNTRWGGFILGMYRNWLKSLPAYNMNRQQPDTLKPVPAKDILAWRKKIEEESRQWKLRRYDVLSRLPQYWMFRDTGDSLLEKCYTRKQERISARMAEVDSADVVRRFISASKVARNERLKAGCYEKFRRYVPFPYGHRMRLNEIVEASDTVYYLYREQVRTDENSSRMYLTVEGSVDDWSRNRFLLPPTDTLTYFVSSMTYFIVDTTRYVQRVIKRDMEVEFSAQLHFRVGKWNIEDTISDNCRELAKIRSMMYEVMTDTVYGLDSLFLSANSSPEGSYSMNMDLSFKRANSVRDVVASYLKHLNDSLNYGTMEYMMDDSGRVMSIQAKELQQKGISELIRVRAEGEDWRYLKRLVSTDERIAHRAGILVLMEEVHNSDVAEKRIAARYPTDYRYMRNELYPQLRRVVFRFFLRRKGMLEEQVLTNEVDTVYANGLNLLKQRRYADALERLRPYEDVNTAVAYMSLGYDEAALRILGKVHETESVFYLRAIVKVRLGKEREAVDDLLQAVEIEPQLRFRANLDPELSALMLKYRLFEGGI